jgi:hypothetical protein
VGFHVMYFFVHFNPTSIFSTSFRKTNKTFQENPFIGSHLVAWVQTHGLKNKKRQTVQR